MGSTPENLCQINTELIVQPLPVSKPPFTMVFRAASGFGVAVGVALDVGVTVGVAVREWGQAVLRSVFW